MKYQQLRRLSALVLSALLLGSTTVWATKTTPPLQTQPLPTVPGKDLSKDIQSNQSKLQKTREEMDNLRGRSAQLQKDLEAMEAESEEVRKEQERVERQLQYAKETVDLRLKEVAEARESLSTKKKNYQKRMERMFFYRQRSWMEVLLDSKGMDGFFSNLRMIRAISDADQKMIEDLKTGERIAQEKERLAQETLQSYESFLEEKTAQLEQLKQGIVDAEASKKDLSAALQQRGLEEQDLEKTLAEQMAAQAVYEENSRQLEAQIKKVEQQNQELARQQQLQQQKSSSQLPSAAPGWGQGPLGGARPSFIGGAHPAPVWPFPGFHTIWSPYGYRDMGYDVANGYVHTGTDIGGSNPEMQPVVASWDGVVVSAKAPAQGQMFSPNANYVQINHGGGLGSGYWHLYDVVVSEGQMVKAGQVIGHCGSTGMSTGPHLHFEIYDQTNGNPSLRNTVDPMTYLGR